MGLFSIAKAQYLIIDERPVLRVEINGKEALISEINNRFLQKGLVPLTSRDASVNWEKSLPVIHFEGADLRGFTNDPVIVKLTKQFWKDCNDPAQMDTFDGREINIR